jgi:hypothetical protein
MRSLDIARAFVDLASFSTGIGLTILFDTLVDPDGNETRLLLQHPELGALATSVKNIQKPEKAEDNNYDRVARLVTTNYPVSRALHDLIDAIRETHVSPLVCGRAIEGIRHAMAPRLDSNALQCADGRLLPWSGDVPVGSLEQARQAELAF